MGQGEVVMRPRALGESWAQRLTIGHRRGQKDSIAPNNWCGMPQAWEGRFPADVLPLTPCDRRIGVHCDPGGRRTSPRRPVELCLRRAVLHISLSKYQREDQLAEKH